MRQVRQTLQIETGGAGLYEFTPEVRDFVRAAGIGGGLLTAFEHRTRPHRRQIVPHLIGEDT